MRNTTSPQYDSAGYVSGCWYDTGGIVHFYAGGNASSGTAAPERMRIDSSGQVGIGQSPNSNQGKLQINQTLGGTINGAIRITDNATTALVLNNTSSGVSGIWSSGILTFGTGSGTNTEVGRFDTSGNLLLGTTNYSYTTITNGLVVVGTGGTTAIGIGHITGASSGTNYAVFNYNGTTIGSITQNGTTGVLFNTSSDQRLKTDLGQVTSTNVIDNTIVHDFIWKSDGTQSRGVFAQEAHKVIPQAVKVGDDEQEVEDVWAVDYSKYVPDIIVYCQQLKSEIQSLKAEIATLKP
jgi:hypothetical protein